MSLSRFRLPTPVLLFGLLVLALVAQAPLLMNPGYFSHDELQWGAFSDVATWTQLNWVDWTAVGHFQYRPLTFNTWLLVSHALFGQPHAFHALFVALGLANAALLGGLLHRLGLPVAGAGAAALVFVLSPYAVYVQGWVATLADVWVMGLGLLAAHAALSSLRRGHGWVAALPAFVLTTLALLAKESAVSLPALALLAWWTAGRPRPLAWVTLGAALPTIVYLALRVQTILFGGPDSGSYGWSPMVVPLRWVEYHVFPLLVSRLEVLGSTDVSATRIALSLLLWAALVFATWRARRASALWLVLGGVFALAPVLVLRMSANQYAYLFSAVAVAAVALAWPAMARGGRALVVAFALLLVWHGLNIQHQMLRVGRLQAAFQPSLAEALQSREGALRVRLPAQDDWIFRRIGFNVPHWRGVPIGERLQLVDHGAEADYAIADDGRLVPVAP